MNRTELEELIRNGENSGVEFKRDDVVPERLAKELAALLNLEGGHLLLGVEDDGTVTGLTREPKQVEEWIMEVARVHLRPAAIPFWETLTLDDGNVVGVISLPADAPDKPYKAKRGTAWMTQVRVGTTTRDATDAEEARLYMQSGHLQYDRKPIPGATFDDLDLRRLVNYFRDLRQQGAPEDTDLESWLRLLVNTELMVEDRTRPMPSAGGLLLFGLKPNRFLPRPESVQWPTPAPRRTMTRRPGRRCEGPQCPCSQPRRTIPGSRPTPCCHALFRRLATPLKLASSSKPSTSCAATSK